MLESVRRRDVIIVWALTGKNSVSGSGEMIKELRYRSGT